MPLTLVQAVLKGDKMDDVVRDATMMGVAAIEPIVTARTIGAGAAGGNERWATSGGGLGQAVPARCRPGDRGPGAFQRLADRERAWLRLLLVEPSAAARAGGGVVIRRPRFVLEDHAPGSLALIVGPEGGWTRRGSRAQAEAGRLPSRSRWGR